VPVYNLIKRIGTCIEMLLAQTYSSRSYKIIVVDNGSTDVTPDIVKQFPAGFEVAFCIQEVSSLFQNFSKSSISWVNAQLHRSSCRKNKMLMLNTQDQLTLAVRLYEALKRYGCSTHRKITHVSLFTPNNALTC